MKLVEGQHLLVKTENNVLVCKLDDKVISLRKAVRFIEEHDLRSGKYCVKVWSAGLREEAQFGSKPKREYDFDTFTEAYAVATRPRRALNWMVQIVDDESNTSCYYNTSKFNWDWCTNESPERLDDIVEEWTVEVEEYAVNPAAFEVSTQSEIENAVKTEVAKVVAEVMLKVPALMKEGYSAQAAQAQLLVESSWCYSNSGYFTLELQREIDYYKGLKVLRAKSKARLQEAEALLKKIEDEDSRKALIRNKLLEMADAIRIAPEDDGSNDDPDEVEYVVPAVVENDDDDELIDPPEIETAEIVKFEVGKFYDCGNEEFVQPAQILNIAEGAVTFLTSSMDLLKGTIRNENGVEYADCGKFISAIFKNAEQEECAEFFAKCRKFKGAVDLQKYDMPANVKICLEKIAQAEKYAADKRAELEAKNLQSRKTDARWDFNKVLSEYARAILGNFHKYLVPQEKFCNFKHDCEIEFDCKDVWASCNDGKFSLYGDCKKLAEYENFNQFENALHFVKSRIANSAVNLPEVDFQKKYYAKIYRGYTSIRYFESEFATVFDAYKYLQKELKRYSGTTYFTHQITDSKDNVIYENGSDISETTTDAELKTYLAKRNAEIEARQEEQERNRFFEYISLEYAVNTEALEVAVQAEIENAEIVKFEIGNYYKATDAETGEIAPSVWLVDIRGNKAIFRTDSDEFFNGKIVTEKGVQTVTAQMPDFGEVIVSAIKDTFIAEAEYEPYDEETVFAELKDIIKAEIIIEVTRLINRLNATAITVTSLADIVKAIGGEENDGNKHGVEHADSLNFQSRNGGKCENPLGNVA